MLNALLHHAPAAEASCRAPASCIAWTRTPAGCWWWPRTSRRRFALVRQLQARTVKRTYLALVRGKVLAAGTVDAPIGRHPVQRTRMAVVRERQARGHALPGARALRARTRCSSASSRPGAPTRSACTSLRSATPSKAIRYMPGAGRNYLPARRCTPGSSPSSIRAPGKAMAFESPLPKDFHDLLAGLRP